MPTTIYRKMSMAFLISCCCFAAVAAHERSSDADAIADLGRSLVKPPSSWRIAGDDVCSFKGISCSSSGRVTAIDLAAMGLAGTLPSSLSSLTALESLQLRGNALSGAIPPLRFPSLTNLSLDGNAFTSLPEDFPRGMPALQHVTMDNLPFLPPWSFPEQAILAGCPSLRTFSASNASIAGPLTNAIANLKSITTLRLSHNLLTGVVPPALGKSASLRDISLSGNYLQGPVPQFAAGVNADVVAGNGFCLDKPGPCDALVATLLRVAEGFGYPLYLARSWKGNDPCGDYWLGVECYLSSRHVSTIFLYSVDLSGTISPAIGDLTKLKMLNLANNSLTGGIPESLTTLPRLEVLDVTNNKLTGQVPKFKPYVRVLTDGNAFSPPGSK
ncbi:hypothetical protein QOZ80_4BG0351990 [Eleusine coracana subsp. coracana]|nr:hypothetical protein QOZ80_4BG0351990 [Eleusine coracana subsp. coracana]